MNTQTARLRDYLVTHPGASSLEIQRALSITNATGRMSELRAKGEADGFTVVREKRSDGRDGYRIKQLAPLDLGLAS